MKNKIFIIISMFVGIIVFTLFSSIFLLEKFTINTLSKEQLSAKKSERISFFNNFIEHRQQLLESVASNPDLLNFIAKNQNKSTVENLFLSFSQSHQEIFQFRYIDKNGDEIIRVDSIQGNAKLVPKEELQNKKGRYYFEDTLKNKDNIYYSNIDLNVEHGEIQRPIVPTLRLATSIMINGKAEGIIILNINLTKFLIDLQNSPLHYVNLIYDDGEIIINKESAYNWSRDFNRKVKVLDLFEKFPKNFNYFDVYKDKNYYLSKLPINTPNKIYMLLVPRQLNKYTQLHEEMKSRIYILIFVTLLGIPIGYFVSSYITNLYKRQLVYERTKTDNILINSVINSTNDLIFYKDKKFNYIGCNQAFEGFVGKTREEILEKNDFDIFDDEVATSFRQMDEKMLEEGDIRVNNEWVTYANGKEVYLQTKKIPFNYHNGNIGILGISRDITDLYLAQKKIKEQSLIDELTKTFNRRSFNEHMHEKIDLFNRYGDIFCILMYDLDNFKKINDKYGHDVGDKILIETTKKVQKTIRKTDFLFRVGGEEFVILLPKENINNADIISQKILQFIEEMKIVENITVTVSIGLTQMQKGDTLDTLYKRVDTLLYKSKKEGKNQVTIG